jgi:hypothetical protein
MKMRIKHKLDGPQIEKVKEQAINRWIPVVVASVASAFLVKSFSKPPQINIYVTERKVEL